MRRKKTKSSTQYTSTVGINVPPELHDAYRKLPIAYRKALQETMRPKLEREVKLQTGKYLLEQGERERKNLDISLTI